ncbi:hypothetical protein [Nitrosospira sp. NpAV]|uniref:hypothetical protein n=1 Tax=Nitrosospira sp. NpAV TaxID=58133 RepID=UPI00059F9077|nr:hypothetical protein [Nitrosospira sp. NpAV]KIO49717.1 hypothetical protein SQ11_04765 [Nitrosospira sp. NpAV]
MSDTKTDAETAGIDSCVQYAREMLAPQLEKIKDKGYDFAPQFRQMTIQLYLAGVMWRRAESLSLSTHARDYAFTALQSMFISDGMSKKQAQQRIAFLNNMSRVEDGSDTHAITAGYEAVPDDDSLAKIFDEYRDEVRVSGAFWRFYERGKKIMFIGGASAAFVTIWAVTIFLPKTEGIDVLAAGLLAAILVVLPTFLIGLLIYRMKIKKANTPTPPA